MPTLRPGLMRVPRWRMMMEPPVMSWPAKALTPSLCAFESRPFVELPPPFLCAIAESPSKFAALLSVGVGHSIGFNSLDTDLNKVLTVSLELLVLLFPLQVEDQDLFAAAFAEHFGCDLGGRGLGHAEITADQENITEFNGLILRSNG